MYFYIYYLTLSSLCPSSPLFLSPCSPSSPCLPALPPPRLPPLCQLEPIKVVEDEGGGDAGGKVAAEESEGGQKKKKGGKAAKNPAAAKEVKTRVNDSFIIDPYDFALFLPRKTEDGSITSAPLSAAGQDSEDKCRLQVKYVSLVCEAKEEQAIQETIESLRSTDEFADAQVDILKRLQCAQFVFEIYRECDVS